MKPRISHSENPGVDDLHHLLAKEGIERQGSLYRCPLPGHQDNTASFSVFQGRDRGRWKCHGCRESGDGYDLIQRLKGCSFREAKVILGQDPVKRSTSRQSALRSRPARTQGLGETERSILAFLVNELPLDTMAEKYLREHGLTLEEGRAHGLRCISWSADSKRLGAILTDKFPLDVLVKLGVVGTSQYGNSFFKFTDRLLIPWPGKDGDPEFMQARSLTDRPPKYLNISAPWPTCFVPGGRHDKNLVPEPVRVFEGAIDALAFHVRNPGSRCLAIPSASAGRLPELATKITRLEGQGLMPGGTVLHVEQDDAGRKATGRLVDALKEAGFHGRIGLAGDERDYAEIVAERQAVLKVKTLAVLSTDPVAKASIETLLRYFPNSFITEVTEPGEGG